MLADLLTSLLRPDTGPDRIQDLKSMLDHNWMESFCKEFEQLTEIELKCEDRYFTRRFEPLVALVNTLKTQVLADKEIPSSNVFQT